MAICMICRFETELDDQVVSGAFHCICLRCFDRETGNTRIMPQWLQREVRATLAEISAA